MTARPQRTGAILSRLILAIIVPIVITACSSDSSGLKNGPGDGAAAVPDSQRADSVQRFDGAGGTTTPLDAALPNRDSSTVPGTGGRGPLDSGGMGGQGGAAQGDALGRDATSTPGIDASAGGRGGTGGGVRPDALGQGGRTGGSGGTMGVDGAAAPDAAIDAAAPGLDTRPDSPADAAVARNDVPADRAADRADTRSIDGATECGELDMPCCDQRTCNAADLVCTGGGGTARGTCVACGDEGEACCEGDTCTAPGTSCTGGGRGGAGTCR